MLIVKVKLLTCNASDFRLTYFDKNNSCIFKQYKNLQSSLDINLVFIEQYTKVCFIFM